MQSDKKRLGAWGERAAADHLERLGYAILGRNYRCPIGEIDIVARHGEHLVFVEVRTRRSHALGTPEESITPSKRQRLIDLAQTYLQGHELTASPWRIDIVAVEPGHHGAPRRIEVIENAI